MAGGRGSRRGRVTQGEAGGAGPGERGDQGEAVEVEKHAWIQGMFEAEMVGCCNKYGGGEDAGMPRSLSILFRAMITGTHFFLAIYSSWRLGQAPGKGWSGGLRAHQTLLPAYLSDRGRTLSPPSQWHQEG